MFSYYCTLFCSPHSALLAKRLVTIVLSKQEPKVGPLKKCLEKTVKNTEIFKMISFGVNKQGDWWMIIWLLWRWMTSGGARSSEIHGDGLRRHRNISLRWSNTVLCICLFISIVRGFIFILKSDNFFKCANLCLIN